MTPRYSETETETREATASEPLTFAGDFHQPPPWSPRDGVALQPAPGMPPNLAVRAFTQTLGLHPLAGFMTVAVDTMVFSGVILTVGALMPIALGAGVVLGYVTYKIQRTMYGDSVEVAKVKALSVGLLTALPSPLPYGLLIPASIVGFIHGLRRKS